MVLRRSLEPVGLVRSYHSYNEPDIYSYLQDIDLSEDKKRNHHQPHPRAKKCTRAAAMLVAEAAVKAGAPEGIIDCLEEPTVEMSGLIMANADEILATGVREW